MDHPMMQNSVMDWVLLGVMVGMALTVLYIIASAMRRKQQNEMQRHMLEKFASAKDFAEFLQSPVGQKYVMSFSETVTSPSKAILVSVRTGVVLMFAGASIAATVQASTQNSYAWGLGVVITCVGLGFLVSAAISYWLAKKMAREAQE